MVKEASESAQTPEMGMMEGGVKEVTPEYRPIHLISHCLRLVVGSWMLRLEDPAAVESLPLLENLHSKILTTMGQCQKEENPEAMKDEGEERDVIRSQISILDSFEHFLFSDSGFSGARSWRGADGFTALCQPFQIVCAFVFF
jgi:hypothetical protein